MATKTPTTLKWFSALTGLTSLSILAQAVIAGEFVSQKHRGGWIDVHDVVQIVIGHQITDNNQDWLIGIHVPLAFIIFGIAIWLPINSVMLRRASATTP
jgi:hypothetical protein